VKLKAALAGQQKLFQSTFARQQEEIKGLTASLKEQASLLEKVNAQLAIDRPAPRMVVNDR
jgi:septal ring factor EnvC (AmiA/AmiB activator)